MGRGSGKKQFEEGRGSGNIEFESGMWGLGIRKCKLARGPGDQTF
jgi:hypothetical protein